MKQATALKDNAQQDLPCWDLSDLYAGMDDPQIQKDMDWLKVTAENFEKQYKGKLESLSGKQLAEAIAAYEKMDERFTKLFSFAGLLYAADMSIEASGQFQQAIHEKATELSRPLIFFGLEINRLKDISSPDLDHYRPWLNVVRAYIPHQLSDELESYIHDKSVTGRAAWSRLFDESLMDLRFPIGGKEVTSTEALNFLSDKDEAKRKEAAIALGDVFGKNARVFTYITNVLAKDKEISDQWRKFDDIASSRHLSNQVEPEVVDALVRSVKEAYPKLAHRYYGLKAKWFGRDQLDYWNRNAPLPKESDDTFTWDGAREVILNAYSEFSAELGAVGKRFFDNAWIDAPPRAGKNPGAFAHPCVPSVHPYLLVNFYGKIRDVMTIAHELGHGVHQVLAGKQGPLMCDTPLTLAETASVFGEMLTFRSLLSKKTSKEERKILLASKVEDMLNTVVRQIAFYDFERRVHTKRQQGELGVEDVCKIWMDVQTESLGPVLKFDENYKYYWTYIGHFIHSPFYVYAYAFGDCLVNSLYAVYEEEKAKGKGDAFAKKYLDMLSAGGTLRHKELLAPFGLDASKPDFWSKGLGMIAGLIDEIVELEGA